MRGARLAVIVAALGYFVDIYDLLLFGIVRKTSLLGIGVAEKDLLSAGTFLLNVQMGALLVGGVGVLESGVFERAKADSKIARGSFLSLFANAARARRYVSVILVGVPIWYVVAILITFSPEVGKAMGMKQAPDAALAIMV